MDLGRVNVFIGENGAGKSNILEAIALAGAAQAQKLDNEFLASRGIRVSSPHLMRSAFDKTRSKDPITVSITLINNDVISFKLINDEQPYSTWQNSSSGSIESNPHDFLRWIKDYAAKLDAKERDVFFQDVLNQLEPIRHALKEGAPPADSSKKIKLQLSVRSDFAPPPTARTGSLEDFIIYSPENSALRMFEREGQIEPLGINGEGLLKLLAVMAREKNKRSINAIKESLRLFNWFEDFTAVSSKTRGRLEIVDHFLDQKAPVFDQRSANEGFLFLAFYLALFTSKLTPHFFAIDNVDTSLNPKLCEALMKRLTNLASEYKKQVLLTTHNPAILDGLDISDPDNRLFIVSRGTNGHTRVRRFQRKTSQGAPQRLSALFLSGALGGLPKGF